ncbi:ASI1-immunoprecipitated protein 3 [Primulina huaijiensis]|uniref:ASI1-immunoprecipitated protein 3 n=1 Tax=Primulina huaijiensis TaxID=1492673 RepID=UPI003CC72A86
MRNRRLARVPTSDEEDDAQPLQLRDSPADENQNQRKRKKVNLSDEEEEENEREVKSKEKRKRKEATEEPEPEDEEQEDAEAQPMGEIVRVSGKGRGRRNHYESFELDGLQYHLEDPVLLAPERKDQKPYVAIIKDITQTWSGDMMVTGQWFYRPEEAEKRTGGNWESRDTRELFYSFHRDEVPAESVLHKCVVHFIPLHKQIPHRKQHPGFIVQKVYDTDQRKLFKLTDKDYEDNKQQELDDLVQKTLKRLGDVPDLEPEDMVVDREDQIKSKRLIKKKNMTPLDVSRDNECLSKSQLLKPETPGSTGVGTSEYNTILSNFMLLTGETQRDKWLEKLLQSVQFICSSVDGEQNDGEKGGDADVRNKVDESFDWPDAAVHVIVDLEKAAHDSLSTDFQKYNQKMRQLAFNLKSNAVLARRLLKRELDSAQILNMSPNELKEGLTSEEISSREPEESGRMQMTDARCKRCMEKQVGLREIIQTGHGDRYQLECNACGNTWYASRDDVSSLTIEGSSSAKTVGAAPLATAKFEDVEKNLVSPRGAERGANDVLKKATEAYVPVLDNQQSSNKT